MTCYAYSIQLQWAVPSGVHQEEHSQGCCSTHRGVASTHKGITSTHRGYSKYSQGDSSLFDPSLKL